jgi:Cd2+/Zn2+-exporting ATPase
MNLLMCVAVAGAILLGQWLEAAMVTFLFSLALLLEHWSVDRARRAIEALLDLSPATARRRAKTNAAVQICPVQDVQLGETVVVRPGERIPLDGRVLEGCSAVNQAPITGESMPVDKKAGDPVFAGTINGAGVLEFMVTHRSSDTTIARIIHMVQQAHARRAPTEQWVETFAQYYTPAMFGLAILIALLPPLVSGAAWQHWAYNSLVVLVIACPCALVISTPVSIVSALATAARHGVLIKGGRYLEAAASIRAVAIDKTGTLTQGKPVVQEIVPLNGHSRDELLQRAAAMEAHSTHPIAQAILDCARNRAIEVEPVRDYQSLSGRGAEATFRGKRYWIGSHRLMLERMPESEDIHSRSASLEDAGHSLVAIGNQEHVCGLISIADAVREQAANALTSLRSLGVRHITMLTGDNHKTAREIAKLVGVDDYRSETLPEDKLRYIQTLLDEHQTVAMVGDGVNDSPAMAASSLGIAMGAIGSDAAIETADVALMSDDLSRLPWLIQLARRSLSIIKQNVAFALGLKFLFLGLTLFGAASLWAAIAADMGASLIVIFNALRLLRW